MSRTSVILKFLMNCMSVYKVQGGGMGASQFWLRNLSLYLLEGKKKSEFKEFALSWKVCFNRRQHGGSLLFCSISLLSQCCYSIYFVYNMFLNYVFHMSKYNRMQFYISYMKIHQRIVIQTFFYSQFNPTVTCFI